MVFQKSHDVFVRNGAPLSRAFVFGTRFRRFTYYKNPQVTYRRSGRPLGIGVSDSRHGVVVVWLECS